jgi:hypothetical protein
MTLVVDSAPKTLVPGILLGVNGGRPVRKADKLTTICEPIV